MSTHSKTGQFRRSQKDTSELSRAHASIYEQARSIVPFLSVLYFFPLAILLVLVVIHRETGVGLVTFMRDPADLMGVNPFWGVVSNLGVLVWCASAAVCLFTWTVLRDRLNTARYAHFVLWAGLLSALLLADDFFELHEIVFPQYLYIPEKFTYAVYGMSALALLLVFRDCILRTEYLMLLLSLGLLGFSMLSDAVQPQMEQLLGEWRILSEDGLKFLGIVGWFGYFLRSCFLAVHRSFAE